VPKRIISLLLLQDDSEIHLKVKEKEDKYDNILSVIKNIRDKYTHSLSFVLSLKIHTIASDVSARASVYKQNLKKDYKEKLSRILMSPVLGFVILVLVLYFGLYKFVGEFGAGYLVDLLEENIFGQYVLPPVNKFIASIIPFSIIRELFVGEYGILSLGLRYAIAIIFPIVTTFFLVFAIIEDTGYLPRLAMLIDKVFKAIGLSGRAVIPMVLGLGCDTMATMVTRTLPTNRERVIATILLTLAVPCSAQLGVIFGLLSNNTVALIMWFIIITSIFTITGFLASKVIPGHKPVFFMEIPPLRLPKLTNVLIKTYSRLKWYFIEIFPLFIYASVLIWIGQITGVFSIIVKGLEYPVRLIGLPDNASIAFLFGFFRRDYGAAGLYDMHQSGLFTGNQLLVATVTLTLFLPCIAQFLMNIKERGLKLGLGISVFIVFFSFSIGYLLNLFLMTFDIRI
jgi:ferrous iron transport protein B